MLWHEGDISEAVNKVSRSDQFLVVFLRDSGAFSVHYSNIFENSKDIPEILVNCVCLNLLQGGTEYQQFSEVYKASDVPSIYIITHLGKVIDIIKKDITEDILINRLKKVISNDLNVSQSIENDSKVVTNSTGGGENENQDIDEKMAEIRQKLAEKHRQRKEEERLKEIEDELSRREIGKKVVELKKLQKEQEENEIKDEIKRKRQEDKDARDKVLRQIEEDKQERKKRFVDQIILPTLNTEDKLDDIQVTKSQSINSSTSRIQFRFPDGSSNNKTFNCDDKFALARQFVTDHVRANMNSRKFEIKQFFPRKTLTKEDDLLSFRELQLIPSSSLAVIFLDQITVSSQTSFTTLLFSPISVIINTILIIFQWIKGKISGTSSVDRENNEVTHGNLSNWEERQRRLIAAESRTIKKDGNIAQLSDPSKKDDEDDATWNGNSTQQM